MQPEIVLRATADKTRRKTLAILKRQELNVSELVEVLAQPQSTISRHLKILKQASLIHDRKEGTTTLYSVSEGHASGSDEPRNGHGADLADRLLDWIGQQPLPPAVESRLAIVVQKRSDMSDRFFDRVGQKWDALREESFGPRFHLEAFVSLLPRAWTVADVGTGTGYLLPTLSRHFYRVLAVEPVERMLDNARRRIDRDRLENVVLQQGEVGSLPIEDGQVDLAIAILVLHHVPSPGQALAELCRIVKPGGRVLLVEQTAHNSEAFRDRMQDRWWGFDPQDIRKMFASLGVSDVTINPLATTDLGADAPSLFVATAQKK